MIKLIISDIDGTILKDYSSEISLDFFNLIKKFRERGVYFVAASGRQYSSLLNLFESIKEDTYFMCENGATIRYKDKILFKSTIPIVYAKKVVDIISDIEDLEIVIATENHTFLISKTKYLLEFIKNEIKEERLLIPIKSINEVNDEILKISIFNKNGVKVDEVKPLLNGISENVKGAISGNNWFDYMDSKTNKGTSLEHLCKILNVSLDEVLAFGDNFNDIEMLSKAKYSYAMETAHEDVKNSAKNICNKVEDILYYFYNKFYK